MINEKLLEDIKICYAKINDKVKQRRIEIDNQKMVSVKIVNIENELVLYEKELNELKNRLFIFLGEKQ